MIAPKTEIKFDKEVRPKLLAGVDKMANAVGSTLGPMGQNVAIAKFVPTGEIYERVVLHDGVSVAKSIDLEDEFENMGAQLLKEAAQKQVDQVGDGTTLVMILAQAIIQEAMQLVTAGVNPMSLRKGLEEGSRKIISELEGMAIPVKGIKDLNFVGTVSAEDAEIGELVASTMQKVGKDGIVNAVESKSPETEVEHQEGMQFDKGYAHPYFVTNPNRMEAVLENAYILVTDKSITTLSDWGSFFESFTKHSKNLVVIAPEISGEALPLFIQNRLQGKLFTICINAPGFGEDQKNILQDIAALTDGVFFSQDAGMKFKDLTIDHLGFAESVTATKDETIIVGGRGSKKKVDERIASIRKSIEDSDSEFDTEHLKARLGKLTSGVAVIRVGGHTEVEMKERRERVLDAIGAIRAAMEKGIVPGGEVALMYARKVLKDSVSKKEMSVAEKILYEACHKPFLKLITNADLSEVDLALQMNGKSKTYGVDVSTGEVKDLVKAGIVDPVLVPISAIQNAVSVAIQIISTGCVIVPGKISTQNEQRE